MENKRWKQWGITVVLHTLLRGIEDLMLCFPPFLLLLHVALTYLRLSPCCYCKSLSWTFQKKFHRRLARENWSHMIQSIDNPSDERTLVTTSNPLIQLESRAKLLDRCIIPSLLFMEARKDCLRNNFQEVLWMSLLWIVWLPPYGHHDMKLVIVVGCLTAWLEFASLLVLQDSCSQEIVREWQQHI